ncbi:filamentous hemagglutinin N-terminal domain-containing protein [Microseira wollei]|uniref:filamentous hemagglutinin N-terminal domain-containing protein n=1 Tax=Microseira wollei TaxID=467598 RepID=UPI001CFCBF33|nr:filamentous hemagglutinin N-terminal domain-containing protein [Microseira wollei]
MLCFVTNSPTQAQIVPDATLPVNSTVTPIGNTNTIEGKTTAGGNLFHSFREFSIPTGAEAFFNNAVDIQNIFTRVTGGNISHIDGLILANGTANLFLLNPNGIIFGPNARLNIGGSFFGSTASSIRFADGTFFSATAAQTTPLLTINVPIGLQYGSRAGTVEVQGSNLQVQPGRTLALFGGNVSLSNGILLAPGGRVELGGVASEGTVGLGINGNIGNLSFPDGIGRADVSLSNGSRVNVRAGGGGSMAINASKLDILQKSGLQAGIASELGSIDSRAGNIEINATGVVAIANDSFIINSVQSGGIGDAGGIEISTGSLAIARGARLSASTFGQGDAGTVKITASDTVSFDAGNAFSRVEKGAVGKGGGIKITTNSLLVTGGARLSASTFGQGLSSRPKASLAHSSPILLPQRATSPPLGQILSSAAPCKSILPMLTPVPV